MGNYIYGYTGQKIRILRERLGKNQDEFAKTYRIPVESIRLFELGKDMPPPVLLAYLSVIAAEPDASARAITAEKFDELTKAEQDELAELNFAKIEYEFAREGGRDPEDRILWCGSNGDRLPEDEYRVRYPPKSAIGPCYVKCLCCKQKIDVPLEALENHEEENESFYDIDCPHCWQVSTFTSVSVVQKLVRFRRKCQKWINPPAPKPGRVSASLRFKVLERDGFRCSYCGSSPQQTSLHVDHKIPVNEGGTNELDNLVSACAECNLGKGNSSVEFDL